MIIIRQIYLVMAAISMVITAWFAYGRETAVLLCGVALILTDRAARS